MFCPKCRYEYKDDITNCPDCGDKLVKELPPEPVDLTGPDFEKYENWIHIARINSNEYAEMLIEGLRAKDIPVISQSGTGFFGKTGQMGMSSFPPVGGGYSIYVPEEFLGDADQEAQIILGDIWQTSKLIDIEAEE